MSIGGSAIGSPALIREMLALAAAKDVESWIIKRPLNDVNEVVRDMHASKARCESLNSHFFYRASDAFCLCRPLRARQRGQRRKALERERVVR